MIEFSFQYRPLFTITVLHEYYAEQPAKNLRIEPLHSSGELANRLGMVLKQVDKEMVLLLQPDYLEGVIHCLEQDNLFFTFALFSSDPLFNNFTDLKAEDKSRIFYFSSQAGFEKNKSYLLHKNKYADNGDRVLLRTVVELPGEASGKRFTLKNEQGQKLLEVKVPPSAKYILDNHNLPVGRYLLEEDGVPIEEFILYSDIPVKKPVGLIRLDFTGKLKDELLKHLKQNMVPSYHYYANFRNRQSFWRYYLVSKYNRRLRDTAIVDTDSDMEFSEPEEVALDNGFQALRFTSGKPVGFKERPDYRLQLRSMKKGAVEEKILLSNLPSPSPANIRAGKGREHSKIFSEIIVYV